MLIDINLNEKDIKKILAESLSPKYEGVDIKPENITLSCCGLYGNMRVTNSVWSANVRVETDEKETVKFPRCECPNYLVKNCIIFSTSGKRAWDQLDEIIKEKQSEGVRVRFRELSSVEFGDGERWMVICNDSYLAGIRWHKCLIDWLTPVGTIRKYILPHADLGCAGNYEYF